MTVSWDPAEYLAYGKFLFSGYGFDAYYRPILWPLILGFLWKIGLPMPATMKFFASILYLSIPLIPYFSLKGTKRFMGILIASHPIVFRWSHYPLSHILALFFLILAYSTKDYISGIFSALSGLSRFPFLVYPVFHVIGSKKRFIGAVSAFLVYFFVISILYKDPLAQIKKALEVIGWSKYYSLWPKDPTFYIRTILATSPLLFLGLFTLSKFSFPSLISILFYSFFVARKEDRFAIDFIPFLSISLEKYRKILMITLILNLVQLPFIKVYPEDFHYFLLIEDNSKVLGMHPGVNAYRDVYFIPWFDYFQEFNFSEADYCIFFKRAIPCPDSFCVERVKQFYSNCSVWEIVYNQSDEIVIGKVIPRLS